MSVNTTYYQAPLPNIEFQEEKTSNFVKACIQPLLLPAANSNFFSTISSFFSRNFTKKLEAQKQQAITQEGAEEVFFKTGDNALINGMYFSGSAQKKAILYVGGQNERYELGYKKIRDLKQEAGDPSLFVFNPRTVGLSKGSNVKEYPNGHKLAIDVYSVFHYLVDVEKIDPNDIVIFAHSLGGGYGSEGAKLIQKMYPDKKIQFISHNSFRDLLFLLQKKLPSWEWLQNAIKNVIGNSCWQLDSINALKSLKGEKVVIMNRADSMIPYHTSLYKGIKETNAFSFTPVKMDPDSKGDQHSRRFHAWEMSEISMHISRMLGLKCSLRSEVLAHLNHLEKALQKHNPNAIQTELNHLESFYKEWDGCSNMAHVLFKRLFFLCGENSVNPEFGRQAFCNNGNQQLKIQIVNDLKKEISEYWK